MPKLEQGSVQLLRRQWSPPSDPHQPATVQKEDLPYFDSEDGIKIHLITIENATSLTPRVKEREEVSKGFDNHRKWYWNHLLGFYLGEEGIFFVEPCDRAYVIKVIEIQDRFESMEWDGPHRNPNFRLSEVLGLIKGVGRIE